jgi:hypothetical protein
VRRRPGPKIMSPIDSATPNSYWWSVDILVVSPAVPTKSASLNFGMIAEMRQWWLMMSQTAWIWSHNSVQQPQFPLDVSIYSTGKFRLCLSVRQFFWFNHVWLGNSNEVNLRERWPSDSSFYVLLHSVRRVTSIEWLLVWLMRCAIESCWVEEFGWETDPFE